MALENLVIQYFTIPELKQLLDVPGLVFSKEIRRGRKLYLYARILRCVSGRRVKSFIAKIISTFSGRLIDRKAFPPARVNVYDELGVHYLSPP